MGVAIWDFIVLSAWQNTAGVYSFNAAFNLESEVLWIPQKRPCLTHKAFCEAI
jgi:hypothetical protein